VQSADHAAKVFEEPVEGQALRGFPRCIPATALLPIGHGVFVFECQACAEPGDFVEQRQSRTRLDDQEGRKPAPSGANAEELIGPVDG
jgi:hypothetical protein